MYYCPGGNAASRIFKDFKAGRLLIGEIGADCGGPCGALDGNVYRFGGTGEREDYLPSPFFKGLPDCKPVSVPLRAAVIPLGRTLLPGSSDLPGSLSGAGRSSSPIWSCSAWGLPCRPDYSGRGALLPHHFTLTRIAGGRYIFCGTFRRDPSPDPPRPLAGTLPCGDRTFLPRYRERLPVRQSHLSIVAPCASLHLRVMFTPRSASKAVFVKLY